MFSFCTHVNCQHNIMTHISWSRISLIRCQFCDWHPQN